MISYKNINPPLIPLDKKRDMLKAIAQSGLPNNVICRRNADNDACSECGACCARVLPLYPSDFSALKKYLKENPRLRKAILALNKGIPPLMCPFLDYTKPNHKCLIYDSGVLPLICQYYTCNREKQSEQLERLVSSDNQPMRNVDMWHAFFGKATNVPNIAEAWGYKDFLQDWRFTVPDEYLLNPNRLPEFFANFSWRFFITNTLRLPIPIGLSEIEAMNYLRSIDPATHLPYVWK